MFYNFFFTILPKNLLSKIFGSFSRISFPRFIAVISIQIFAFIYKIKIEEAEKTKIQDYKNLNDFFIRKLKKQARPINSEKLSIISPVDARILSFGKIKEDTILQAKDLDYNLFEFLCHSKHSNLFLNGNYITFYLAPNDYHRIHSPFQGEIISFLYEPGQLYPVNSKAIHNIIHLFSKNERLISFLKTKYGLIAIAKVGAYNVGNIKVTYEPTFQTNQFFSKKKEHFYKEPLLMEKGAELGRFEMGSTVILLFQKDMIKFSTLQPEQKILFGTKIGTVASS